ncbi:SDR family oxidoreductase, partial [Pseudomonas aeruginosa]
PRKKVLFGGGLVARRLGEVGGGGGVSLGGVAGAVFRGSFLHRRLLVLSNVNWRARLLARFFPRLFEKLLVPRLSGLKPQP